MLKLKKPIMATDENGNNAQLIAGDVISEISDAGPNETRGDYYLYRGGSPYPLSGWNVTVRVTNPHWSEIVTCDAVQLLKAVEG